MAPPLIRAYFLCVLLLEGWVTGTRTCWGREMKAVILEKMVSQKTEVDKDVFNLFSPNSRTFLKSCKV